LDVAGDDPGAAVRGPLRRVGVPALALGLALAYVAIALPTVWSVRQAGPVALFWYANALPVAVLMQRSPRQWPLPLLAVGLAVWVANRLAGDAALQALRYVVPNLVEIGLAAGTLRAAGLAHADLQQPVRMLQLLALGSLLPTLVSATLAAVLLGATGQALAAVWLPWFESAAIGSVGLLPLACLALRESPSALRAAAADARLWLLATLALAVALLALAVLPFPFVILSLPLLLAAMVLPPVSVALLVFAVSLAGALAIAEGPFAMPPGADAVTLAYAYAAFAAALVPALVLAAAMADLRASHDRLLQREHELARANQGLEQFVRLASHDLREPLNTITQFGRLVEQDHGAALPDAARRYLALMSGGAERMRRLLDDVLHFARVQRGVITAPQAVALDEVLREARGALAARLERSGAQLDVQPLPWVVGQASMLQLLFQNLLSNAIKFVPAGEVPRVRVSADVVHDRVHVTVADQGIGIAADDVHKLFQPFQRLHLPREYEGTGLGLALAQQIALAHGGRIEVASAPGQGSRFIVTLPLAAGTAAPG
jgi:signal transduction histidine kinase